MIKLNVACGPNIFPYEGWVNYDKMDWPEYWAHLRTAPYEGMPEHQQTLAMFVRAHFPDKSPVLRQDMMHRFPHADDSVDFIYVGQAIEHLNRRTQAVPFLRECHRMLRPGGVLRMTTPDISRLVMSYRGKALGRLAKDQPAWFADALNDDQLSYILFGASGSDCTQTNYEGHFHVYSEPTMCVVLEEAGFEEPNFSPGKHPEIRDEGMSHSLCVEATK